MYNNLSATATNQNENHHIQFQSNSQSLNNHPSTSGSFGSFESESVLTEGMFSLLLFISHFNAI